MALSRPRPMVAVSVTRKERTAVGALWAWRTGGMLPVWVTGGMLPVWGRICEVWGEAP